jgi:hypothetical protein
LSCVFAGYPSCGPLSMHFIVTEPALPYYADLPVPQFS